jgi:hypothetical protein
MNKGRTSSSKDIMLQHNDEMIPLRVGPTREETPVTE